MTRRGFLAAVVGCASAGVAVPAMAMDLAQGPSTTALAVFDRKRVLLAGYRMGKSLHMEHAAKMYRKLGFKVMELQPMLPPPRKP